jgi:purine-binding chemotaxis protein CheW
MSETDTHIRGREGDSFQRWIGFELAGQSYGVPILSVHEVLAEAEIEPVPGAPAPVLGVINLRGSIVTVIDLRQRLGLPSPVDTIGGPLIVFDAGTESIAARVDRVADVRRIADAAIKPPARTGSSGCHAVRGLVARAEELVTLLDVPALLA